MHELDSKEASLAEVERTRAHWLPSEDLRSVRPPGCRQDCFYLTGERTRIREVSLIKGGHRAQATTVLLAYCLL